jgi:YfiH family protein
LVQTLFTNRIGGISQPPYESNNLALHVDDSSVSVSQNRRFIQALVGPTQYMNQTHGDKVALVDSVTSREPNSDALVTTETGIALGVLVADCIPLLLWDEVERVIAAAHVGRRGLLNEVSLKTLAVMNSLGATRIHAMLGPSICGKCYEVGSDVYDEVTTAFPRARSVTSGGTLSLDLPDALAFELMRNGVKVSRSPLCTVENPHFFSYRRDGLTGRQAGLIWQ